MLLPPSKPFPLRSRIDGVPCVIRRDSKIHEVKLLLYSHFFAPSIGGVETIVMSLARGLAELRVANGAPEFDITLVTQTPRGAFDGAALPFSVVRHPGFGKLLTLIRES